MTNTSLIGFVESYQTIFREKASLQLRETSLGAEVKAVGFDAQTVKRVAKARLKSAETIEREQAAKAEKEALFEIYCASLGMLDGTPLGEAARERLAKEFKEAPPPQSSKKKRPEPDAPPEPENDREDTPEPTKAIGPEEIAGARTMGAQAHNDGISVLKNPYVAGDPRRAAWDEGWCSAAGSDGMDIPSAFRRAKKKDDEESPAPESEPKPEGPAR